MIQENDIRGRLVKYLAHELSLDDFEDWFVQNSWNMHKDSSLAAQRLASRVELLLAEHSNGHISEDTLRDHLRPHVVRYVVTASFVSGESDEIEVESSGTSESIPISLVGRPSAVVFG